MMQTVDLSVADFDAVLLIGGPGFADSEEDDADSFAGAAAMHHGSMEADKCAG